MSAKYRMIPSIEVINRMRESGFVPVEAKQGRTRVEGRGLVTRHQIKFMPPSLFAAKTADGHPYLVDKPTYPVLCLSNSHDGTAAYRASLGFYEVLCMNGLMVCSTLMEDVSVRHTGAETLADEVIDASFKVIDQVPAIQQQIVDWSQIELNEVQRLAYAEGALELSAHTLKPDPRQVLEVRRSGDSANDLYRVFNRVQENLVRGGQRTRNANGARRTVRAIKSLDEDTRLNRALWRYTEAVAAKA
jgi:hypothetical protein